MGNQNIEMEALNHSFEWFFKFEKHSYKIFSYNPWGNGPDTSWLPMESSNKRKDRVVDRNPLIDKS